MAVNRMNRTFRPGLVLAVVIAGMAGCASVDNLASKSDDLGEGKQEFETSAQGGVYRFQYVTEGSDGYRTVFWRQGEQLSDDATDAKLLTGVVRSVFHERFCKDMKLPVTLAAGSPAPLGKIGMWRASLRCAEPPPQPKKVEPQKAPKKKPPAASGETVSEAKPKTEAAPKSEKPAVSSSGDGPQVCQRVGDKFECKPKR